MHIIKNISNFLNLGWDYLRHPFLFSFIFINKFGSSTSSGIRSISFFSCLYLLTSCCCPYTTQLVSLKWELDVPKFVERAKTVILQQLLIWWTNLQSCTLLNILSCNYRRHFRLAKKGLSRNHIQWYIMWVRITQRYGSILNEVEIVQLKCNWIQCSDRNI